VHHQEIRYKILFTLYLKHYGEGLGQPYVTNKVIEEAGLEFVEKNMVYGDIVYLKESNQIKGTDALGQPYPYTIIITTKGIDRVDNMLTEFPRFLKDNHNQELNKTEYNRLSAMGIFSGVSSEILKEIKRIIDQYPKEFTDFITSLRPR
jgi:hypothetical protein